MRISRDKFDSYIEAAIEELPPEFKKWLDEVPLIVEDEPPQYLLDEVGVDEEGELLGNYNGVALTHRSVSDSGQTPDHIYIFRQALVDMCETEEELALEIKKTVFHELGHYAGFDEEDLENMGYA